MCGWRSCATARASRRKRSAALGLWSSPALGDLECDVAIEDGVGGAVHGAEARRAEALGDGEPRDGLGERERLGQRGGGGFGCQGGREARRQERPGDLVGGSQREGLAALLAPSLAADERELDRIGLSAMRTLDALCGHDWASPSSQPLARTGLADVATSRTHRCRPRLSTARTPESIMHRANLTHGLRRVDEGRDSARAGSGRHFHSSCIKCCWVIARGIATDGP